MKTPSGIHPLSKAMIILAAAMLAAAIVLPIWQIQLFAPQYPEGLRLLIYANRLAGDVEIINGLNHYIGMQTLHTENFMEFSILRYILSLFVLCFILVALLGRKKHAYILFTGFLLFGIIAMIDFYRWNYNYGHNLDPHAAIKVPGMAYQPPLIGFKQLLNFGAYSIPDTGGWLFIGAGILLLVVVIRESQVLKRWFSRRQSIALQWLIPCMAVWISCGQTGPVPVDINKDACAYCKMTITDARFAAQLLTPKGRHAFFDDISCLVDYHRENADAKDSRLYIADYSKAGHFVTTGDAMLLHSEDLRSPMGGNIAAFAVRDSMLRYQAVMSGTEFEWTQLTQTE